MAKADWQPEKFKRSGPYLSYDGLFVGRFKYGGLSEFKSFMIANFTPDEYFELTLDNGLAPITALQTRKYVSPNMKKGLIAEGLTPDWSGYCKRFPSLVSPELKED